jgi:hypothetical protein
LAASPSNAHAYRLYIFNDPRLESSFALSSLAVFTAISEAFDYDRFFEALSSYFCCCFCEPRFALQSASSSAKP